MSKFLLSCVLACLVLLGLPALAQNQLCTELVRTKLMERIPEAITYPLLQKSGYKRSSSYNQDYKAEQITFANGPNSFTFLRYGSKIMLVVIDAVKPEPLLSSILQVGVLKADALKKVGVKKSHDCVKMYDETGILNLAINFKNGRSSKLLFYATVD